MKKPILVYLFFASLIFQALHVHAQFGNISTIAGNGFSVNDGYPATLATLCTPYGVATDRFGNVYIADVCNNRVRKISGGIITTIAGRGTAGYSGDGSWADSAELNTPYGVAVDDSGNVFIADENNNVIRKVTPAGIIYTIAGNGIAGYSGDSGPATAASLHNPTGVAVDHYGNLYIADLVNNVIRMVNVDNYISTFAGTGTPGYSGDGFLSSSAQLYLPISVAVDDLTNLYIADYWNNVVRKVSHGIISTYAGNGVAGYSGDGLDADSASMYFPTGLALDSSQNLYISDNQNNVVRKVTEATHIISQFSGNRISGFSGDGLAADSAEINNTYGLATDHAGNVYIADAGNNRIRMVNNGGIISTFAGVGTGGSYFGYGSFGGDYGLAPLAYLNRPTGVAIDTAQNVYIADQANNRIRQIIAISNYITTIVGNGLTGYSGDGYAANLATLNLPTAVATKDSDLFIADMGNNAIRRVRAAIITTIGGTGVAGYNGDGGRADTSLLNQPSDLAIDNSGNVFIADKANNRIRKINHYGIIYTVAGNGTAGYSGDGDSAINARLYSPSGITIDRYNNLYIADYINNRVRMVNASGIISTVVGNGSAGYTGDSAMATDAALWNPTDVAVDAHGNLYVSDQNNYRIRKVDTFGIITTIGGNGTAGFSGDGSPATLAELNSTSCITLDDSSNIFIADTRNQRIRKIENAHTLQALEKSDKTGQTSIEILPNPSNGNFSIIVHTSITEPVLITITSITGEQITTIKTTSNLLNNIHLPINAGLYFIEAKTADIKVFAKLVIE